ncbi:hypothetical protein ACR03S_10255 [Limimaricola variabilis]
MPDPYKRTYLLLNVIQTLGFLAMMFSLGGAILMWEDIPTFDLIAFTAPAVIAGLLLMAAGQVGAAILNISRDIRALRTKQAESTA